MSNQKTNQKLALLTGILAAGLLGAILAASSQVQSVAAQANEDTDDDMSTVTTSGTATIEVNPDKFAVTVGVETDGATAQEAASANADLIAQVIAALKKLGIEDEEISTSSYRVYSVYGLVELLAI